MLLRWFEYVGLFWLAPAYLFWFREQLAPDIIPLIILIAAICGGILWRDRKIQKQWQRAKSLKSAHLRPLILTFASLSILTALFTYFYTPDTFLDYPLNNTLAWLAIIACYPLISVIPQEVIFRFYFFHRFKMIFSSKTSCAWLSSISFGLAHLIYSNWIAVAFSFFGGLIFSYRFIQTKSIAVVVIEHTMWGLFIFTIGLGSYFIANPLVS